MEAIDLFSAPARRTLGVSDTEIRTARYSHCDHREDLSDIERALLRQSLDYLPPRSCPRCGGRMILATTPASVERCAGCDQELKRTLIHVVGVNSTTGSWDWYHTECRLKLARRKISAMATFLTTRDLPDCAMCGREYEQHDRPLTTIWAAECDTDDGSIQFWRPAQPFRSRDYPYALIIDSPRYTSDGSIAYGDAGAAHV